MGFFDNPLKDIGDTLSGGIGGIGDTLFGKSPSVHESTKSLLTPEQQQALAGLFPQLQQELQNLPSGGITSTQQSLLDIISGGAGNVPTMGGQLYDSAQEALLNIIGGTQRTPEQFNEFFKTTVQDPLVQQFKEEVIPGIGIKFGSNLFSSAQQDFTGKQVERLGETLGRERSRLAYEDRNQAIQDSLSAATAGAGIESQRFRDALAGDTAAFNELLAAMGVAETERQAILQDEQMRLNILNSLIGAATGQTVENIAVVNPGTSGLLAPLLQGAGQGAGAALAGG